jgi:hypothetical protein
LNKMFLYLLLVFLLFPTVNITMSSKVGQRFDWARLRRTPCAILHLKVILISSSFYLILLL